MHFPPKANNFKNIGGQTKAVIAVPLTREPTCSELVCSTATVDYMSQLRCVWLGQACGSDTNLMNIDSDDACSS